MSITAMDMFRSHITLVIPSSNFCLIKRIVVNPNSAAQHTTAKTKCYVSALIKGVFFASVRKEFPVVSRGEPVHNLELCPDGLLHSLRAERRAPEGNEKLSRFLEELRLVDGVW